MNEEEEKESPVVTYGPQIRKLSAQNAFVVRTLMHVKAYLETTEVPFLAMSYEEILAYFQKAEK